MASASVQLVIFHKFVSILFRALLVICLMLWLKNFFRSGFVQGYVHSSISRKRAHVSSALLLLCFLGLAHLPFCCEC